MRLLLTTKYLIIDEHKQRGAAIYLGTLSVNKDLNLLVSHSMTCQFIPIFCTVHTCPTLHFILSILHLNKWGHICHLKTNNPEYFFSKLCRVINHHELTMCSKGREFCMLFSCQCNVVSWSAHTESVVKWHVQKSQEAGGILIRTYKKCCIGSDQ